MVLVALVVLPHLLHKVLHLLRRESGLAHEYAFPEDCGQVPHSEQGQPGRYSKRARLCITTPEACSQQQGSTHDPHGHTVRQQPETARSNVAPLQVLLPPCACCMCAAAS